MVARTQARATFLDAEANMYLRLYIAERKQGSPNGTKPPENLTDDLSLIRNEKYLTSNTVGPKQIRRTIHYLYMRTGITKQNNGRMFGLRGHSLRKYFKTQLTALGVQPDYIDYFMGHTVSTYPEIQSFGTDRLRSIYSAAGLSIRQKTQASKVETLKEIIRVLGMNPEQLLIGDALIEGAVTQKNPEDMENHQLTGLASQLKQLIRQEVSV